MLLIDDDKFVNFYNKKILKKHNPSNTITSVNSGAKALKHLQDAMDGLVEKPSIIFLDINMPAMNGWEFIEAYNKINPEFTFDIKIVMLTTSSNPEDQERAIKSSLIDDFINKPLSLKILHNTLKGFKV
ncbi:response regulator [uncultured Algibacter sp.]|uniref:response regulator n=1 Tax=uncultured Algibacter sp. TaxID=298659 RepID=UPI00321716F2